MRTEETLAASKVQDLIASEVVGGKREGEKPARRVRKERHCGRCSETGHNARTCKVLIEDVNDSDESE